MELSFDKLLKNYPVDEGGNRIKILGGCAKQINQCAIRLSHAIHKSTNKDIFASYSFMTKSGLKSGQVCTANEKAHARGAEELAKHLAKQENLGAPKKYKPPSKASLKGKTGVVFFKNIKGFRNGQGDHIDIWDGSNTKTGEYFKDSEEVWFWKLN